MNSKFSSLLSVSLSSVLLAAASIMQDFCKCGEVGVSSRTDLKVCKEVKHSGLCFAKSGILRLISKRDCRVPF